MYKMLLLGYWITLQLGNACGTISCKINKNRKISQVGLLRINLETLLKSGISVYALLPPCSWILFLGEWF